MKTKPPAILAIVTLVILVTVLVGCGSGTTAAPKVGDKAPDFTLQAIDGKSISLSDFKGKPVLVLFTAVWCVECAKQMPYIEAVYKQSPDKFVVLTIYREDPVSRVKKHVEDKQWIMFPALPDLEDKVGKAYGLPERAAPVRILVDANGVIKENKPGAFADQNEVETWLNLP